MCSLRFIYLTSNRSKIVSFEVVLVIFKMLYAVQYSTIQYNTVLVVLHNIEELHNEFGKFVYSSAFFTKSGNGKAIYGWN